MVVRFGANDTPELQVLVAMALVSKGITHCRRDESEAELVAYDDLVARFGASDTPELQMQVAKALFLKGIRRCQRDESEAELAAYDDLVARFGASDTLELQQCRLPSALNRQGHHAQPAAASHEAALAAWNAVVTKFWRQRHAGTLAAS